MRSTEGVYLVDGPVLLAEALASGVEIESLYVEPDALDDDVVWTARHGAVRVRDTTAGALAKVLDLGTPQKMVAVAVQRPVELSEVLDAAREGPGPVLVLVGLSDPGNVGTLVRVAEATGCAGVVLTSGSVDVHNPKTVRATAGALFRVPVVEGVDAVEAIGSLADVGVAAVATVGSHDAPAPEAIELTGPVGVVVGNEAHGLDDEVVAACAHRVGIPMAGRVESLNAAVAGSVILFEAARQRRVAAEPSGQRSPGVGQNGRPDHGHPTGDDFDE